MKLAICGGNCVRTRKFPVWPKYCVKEICTYLEEVCNGKLFRGTNYPMFWYDSEYKSDGMEYYEFLFSRMHDCKYGFFVNSGTSALDIAMQSMGFKQGDQVLVSPYTYFASASSIKKNGGVPIFVDIDPATLNINVNILKEYISKKTKAIVVVHFGGIPSNMKKIVKVAEEYELKIIEDCCHTHFAQYAGKPVGSFGEMGCFSFQNSKLISTGEGGAIVTNNLEKAQDMFALHNGGRIYQKYGSEQFEFLGGNYRFPLSSFLFLREGLKLAEMQYRRRYENYCYFVSKIKDIGGVQIIEAKDENSLRDYYIVALRFDKLIFKNLSIKKIVMAINAEGIPCSTSYSRVLYEFPVLLDGTEQLEYYKTHCIETERAKEEVIWFPHYLFLGNQDDVDDIIDTLYKVKENCDELISKRKINKITTL